MERKITQIEEFVLIAQIAALFAEKLTDNLVEYGMKVCKEVASFTAHLPSIAREGDTMDKLMLRGLADLDLDLSPQAKELTLKLEKTVVGLPIQIKADGDELDDAISMIAKQLAKLAWGRSLKIS